MQPTIGRIVHFTLTEQQATEINRRHSSGKSIAARMSVKEWPEGAQAHIGNLHTGNQTLPMLIVAVWPDEYGPGIPGVNGQVFLDGNDVLWVTSAVEGTLPGQWQWPPIVRAAS